MACSQAELCQCHCMLPAIGVLNGPPFALTCADASLDIAAVAELLPGSALEPGFRKLLDALPDTAIDAPRAPVIVSDCS
jgi:hypothetical protein